MAPGRRPRYHQAVPPRPLPLALALLLLPAAARAEPRRAEAWWMPALSADGRRVLLQRLGDDGLRYRAVAVDTGRTVADVDLTVLASLPLETMRDGGGDKPGTTPDLANPALAGDLAQVAALLKDFPLGAGGRIAAHRDGARTAFNAGDRIHLATGGAIGAAVAREASYAPWFTPDGKALMIRREHGLVRGDVVGQYELDVAPLGPRGPGAPVRIPGTAGLLDGFALTGAGDAVRVVVSSEPQIKTCVVEIALTAPYRATTKACLTGGERVVACTLSTTGAWVACTTVRELAQDDPNSVTIVGGKRRWSKQLAFRLRTIDVAAGRVVFDEGAATGPRPVSLTSPTAISDAGVALISRGAQTRLLDSRTGAIDEIVGPTDLGLFARFRTPTELVTVRGDAVAVVDTTTWRRQPQPAADACTPLPRVGAACTTATKCPIDCTDGHRRCSYLTCERGVWTTGEELPPRGRPGR